MKKESISSSKTKQKQQNKCAGVPTENLFSVQNGRPYFAEKQILFSKSSLDSVYVQVSYMQSG